MMSRTSPEVVVAGGGIVGLSAACELARRNVPCVLVERGRLGAEASQAAGGILSPQAEAPPDSPLLPLALRGRDRHVALARELLEETGIDVQHEACGVLSIAFTDAEREALGRLVGSQTARGMRARVIDRAELRILEPSSHPSAMGAALFPDDHRVDNRRLIDAYRALARERGVMVRENEPVLGFEIAAGRVTGVRLGSGLIPCARVINALGAWASAIEGDPRPVPVRPIKGHMMSLTGGPEIHHVVYGNHGYVVPRRDGRLIVGSTMEDVGFDKVVTDEGIARLRGIAAGIAPHLSNAEIAETWSGLRPATPDGLPAIGDGGATGLVVALGLFRNGILLGPLVGEIAASISLGETPAIDLSPFSPGRFR